MKAALGEIEKRMKSVTHHDKQSKCLLQKSYQDTKPARNPGTVETECRLIDAKIEVNLTRKALSRRTSANSMQIAEAAERKRIIPKPKRSRSVDTLRLAKRDPERLLRMTKSRASYEKASRVMSGREYVCIDDVQHICRPQWMAEL